MKIKFIELMPDVTKFSIFTRITLGMLIKFVNIQETFSLFDMYVHIQSCKTLFHTKSCALCVSFLREHSQPEYI